MQKSLKSFSFLSILDYNKPSQDWVDYNLKGRRRRFRKIRTFQSPALGPETIPSSITSMQTNGCLRFGACFRTCALANLSISLASPRDSNLLALWRLATQGLLRSTISRAHRRAVLTNSLGATRASTRPKLRASSPLTGFDVYINKFWEVFWLNNRWMPCQNQLKESYKIKENKGIVATYQHHFKRLCETDKSWQPLCSWANWGALDWHKEREETIYQHVRSNFQWW